MPQAIASATSNSLPNHQQCPPQHKTQTIVAGSALLLIVALACAAAKSLLLFVVVAYVMFACWYITKPEAPPLEKRRPRSARTTGVSAAGQACGWIDSRWSDWEPFDFDEIGVDDSPDDFPFRRIALANNVAGYIDCVCDPSGIDIHGNDATGFDPMGYDHGAHAEFDDHLFHDFIDSGIQIDTDWLSTPCWESA